MSAPPAAPPLRPWLLRASDLQFDRDARGDRIELGRGGFAAVYRGTHKGRPVAIKQLLGGRLTAKATAALAAEVEVMWRAANPCVVRVVGAVMDGGAMADAGGGGGGGARRADDESMRNPAIVMELLEGGDLFRFMRDRDMTKLSWTTRCLWLWHIAIGLAFLHSKRVAHRDLKSPNCLLSVDHKSVKLSDFGLAHTRAESESTMAAHLGSVVGTIRWLAPESFTPAARYNYFAADVWAYGCLVQELLTGKVPWSSLRTDALQAVLAANPHKLRDALPRNAIPASAPAELVQLMRDCLQMEPGARPKMDEVQETVERIYTSVLSAVYKQERPLGAAAAAAAPAGSVRPRSAAAAAASPLPSQPGAADGKERKEPASNQPGAGGGGGGASLQPGAISDSECETQGLDESEGYVFVQSDKLRKERAARRKAEAEEAAAEAAAAAAAAAARQRERQELELAREEDLRALTRHRAHVEAERRRFAKEEARMQKQMDEMQARMRELELHTQRQIRQAEEAAAASARVASQRDYPHTRAASGAYIPVHAHQPVPMRAYPSDGYDLHYRTPPRSSMASAAGSRGPGGGVYSGSMHSSSGSANGSPLLVGPRGGTYYINSNGNKTYVRK